ncbi:aldolase [Rhodococcus hoagii]|uniref:Aldolase n=1 Tax=Rhodococcus hoagii TaxID=43767 RepID=A0AAE2W516_RHOHA|nr:aldolase [Prescottella equi]MBM4510121.1 aldolase [Prescottella equi]MBM4541535.1 aldolase [Prescottella equi]MBM4714173.1 aldolase [Prescottella equi]NKS10940.1 aldolase [Prescottella equi]
MTLAAENPETRTAAARSWLLAAAVGEDALSAAARAGADCLVVDLEDGVPFARKSFARQLVREWLSDNPSWVRIGDMNSGQHALDVEVVRGTPGVLGVVLAKAESAEDVRTTARELPGLPIVPMIESALALTRAVEIAAAGPAVRLAFGVGDFRHDTGVANTPAALTYARSRLVGASRAAGLPGPIDGPSAREEAVALDTRGAAELGMTGRLAVRPADAAVINDALSPTLAEIDSAAATIDRLRAHGEHVASGADVPRLAAAKAVLRRARQFGLPVDG